MLAEHMLIYVEVKMVYLFYFGHYRCDSPFPKKFTSVRKRLKGCTDYLHIHTDSFRCINIFLVIFKYNVITMGEKNFIESILVTKS